MVRQKETSAAVWAYLYRFSTSRFSQSLSQLFHGPTPRSPLHRLAQRLAHRFSPPSSLHNRVRYLTLTLDMDGGVADTRPGYTQAVWPLIGRRWDLAAAVQHNAHNLRSPETPKHGGRYWDLAAAVFNKTRTTSGDPQAQGSLSQWTGAWPRGRHSLLLHRPLIGDLSVAPISP